MNQRKPKNPRNLINQGAKDTLKSELTSFDTAAIVYELNKTIIGARIENIYQTSHLTIIFRLHQPNQPALQLLIEAGKRVHLTSYVLSKPLTPPAFCMALRKHLRNGRITEIQQHEFERVITIKIGTREGTFLMVTELFGDGNIILVNPQGKILYALTYKRMRDRNIIREENYKHAPSSGKNPLHLNQSNFDEIKNYGHLETVRALTKLLSIGGLYAEEILLRAKIDKNTPCEALTKQQIDAIFTQTQTLISKITKGEFEPSIVVDEKGEWIDVTPFPLSRYANLTLKPYKSFNEALDEYYSKVVTIGKVSDTEKEYTRELAKLQRTLEDQQKTLEDAKRIIEQNKATGNIIYTHLGELQLLAQKIMEEKSRDKAWEQIVADIEKEKQARHVPFIYFQSLDSKRRVLNVYIENTTFSLDLTRSIQANAASYYERAKKTERKQEGAKKALRETQTKIQELQKHLLEKTEKVIELAPLKKKEKAWYEKFRWLNSSDGFLIIGGRDATTNEIIIKKHTEPTDIVFHADIVGAPFVVIKTEGKTPSEQTINEAAQLAASYSKAWRELFHAIDVYWVHPNQLSKSPPPGQYLEKGSFIVHGKKNYLRKILLSIAIGVTIKENQIIIVGGPTEFVKKQAIHYIEIAPGQEPSNSLAKQIRKMLAEKTSTELRKPIMATPLEEIQKFIPSGKGAIALQP
jgi:predicted ribosome quality control (RQC) complex YloA/Tae2 family protein